MTHTARKKLFEHPDQRVVVYAALFLVCAVLGALGLGESALMAFFPVAVGIELFAAAASHQHRNTSLDKEMRV